MPRHDCAVALLQRVACVVYTHYTLMLLLLLSSTATAAATTITTTFTAATSIISEAAYGYRLYPLPPMVRLQTDSIKFK